MPPQGSPPNLLLLLHGINLGLEGEAERRPMNSSQYLVVPEFQVTKIDFCHWNQWMQPFLAPKIFPHIFHPVFVHKYGDNAISL